MGDRSHRFHEGQPNALLAKHFATPSLAPGARIFLPLCGKTRDIAWLLSLGFDVAGAELSETAVQQLFEGLGLEPEIGDAGALKTYRAQGLRVFVGDIFELGKDALGPVDLVYDRAALVALPDEMRRRYAHHLLAISGAAPQLLITFDYDQSVMPGPPFCVPETVVRDYYAQTHEIRHLEGVPVDGRLKGQVDAIENIWHLTPR